MARYQVKLGKNSIGKPVTIYNATLEHFEIVTANSEMEAVNIALTKNPGFSFLSVKKL